MIFKNNDGKTIETDNNNLFSMLEREGFKKVDDNKKALLIKAKELGIKGAHLMSEGTLITEIAARQP